MSTTELLLHDADRLVRRAAIDRDHASTVRALVTWPELVEAVHALVTSQRDQPDPAVASTLAMVDAIATTLHHDQVATGWPPRGVAHEGLLRAAERVNQATEIASSHREPACAATTHQALSMLLHAAHVISSGVDDYLNHQLAHEKGEGMVVGAAMLQRVARCEQLLDAVVNPWPWVAPPPTDLDPTRRLAATLSGWDVAAHRSLGDPTVMTVRSVATGQAMATRAAGVLLYATETTGRTGTAGVHVRLAQAVTLAASRWQELAVVAAPLSFAVPADRAVHEAQLELRGTIGSILRDGSQIASAAKIADRIDLNIASRLGHQVLIASADLAKATQRIIEDAPLPGSPRAMLSLQRGLNEQLGPPGVETHLIEPADALRNRPVPIPVQMRGGMRHGAGDVVEAAGRAADLTIVAHPPSPAARDSRSSTGRRPELPRSPGAVSPPGPDR